MKALIVHRDLMPALQTLPDEQLGTLMRAAMSLVSDERDEAPPDPALAFAWHVLRAKILETGQKYDEECAKRADHARRAALASHDPARRSAAPRFPSLPKQARA